MRSTAANFVPIERQFLAIGDVMHVRFLSKDKDGDPQQASVRGTRRLLRRRVAVAVSATALLSTVLGTSALTSQAGAFPIPGTTTTPTTPAEFLPAPNPTPYCANPDYFGAIDQLVSLADAGGAFDVDPTFDQDGDGNPTNDTGPSQHVTQITADTGPTGISLVATTTATAFQNANNPIFTPRIDLGGAGTGVSVSGGGAMDVVVSEPLFYSQWIFTDVDLAAEGFEVIPDWAGTPAPLGLFGGDANYTFAGTTDTFIDFNDTNSANAQGSDLRTRVQADFYGPVNGLSFVKTGQGLSGFTVGGGCEALGLSKVASAPVLDPATGEITVTYTIEAENLLPDTATLQAIVDAAESAADSSFVTGDPVGIDDTALQIVDTLDLTGFSGAVTTVTAPGLTPNPAYDGVSDTNLLAGTDILTPGATETVGVEVVYTPDYAHPDWADCAVSITNQATGTAVADGVTVTDTSDDGPLTSGDNGAGATDDPTVVDFVYDCEISLAKDITSAPVANSDGTFTLEYTLVAENTGDLPLSNPVINDDLASAFASAASFTSTVVSDSCVGSTLNATDTCSQVLSVTFDPGGTTGPYDNSAEVTADGPGGSTVTDTSQDGAVADANGDGDPTNDSVPTSFVIPPELTPDESLGNPEGSTVVVDVLGNDPSIDIDPTTVMIIDPATGLPVTSLVVPGEGTWTVDPVTGAITFIPEPGFTGDPTPITYEAADTNGTVAEPVEVVVTYAPELADDESLGNPEGSTVVVDVLGNDPSIDIDPTTVMIIDPATGLPVTSLVVPGEGTWTVDPVTGAITFIPEPGFPGDPTPITYEAADFDGHLAEPVEVVVTYLPLGEIPDDENLNNVAGTAVVVDILANDGDVDPTSVQLIDPATGLPIAGDLVVPGEGTWTVDPVTGALTFTPEPGFLGDPTPIDYSVNNAQGIPVEATAVVTYLAPEPIPSDENLNNVAGTAVTVDILANDGDVDPTSVQLVDPVTSLPVTGDLVVPGEGTWTVDPVSGALTFTPEDSFTGDPTPVDYVVTSVLGAVVTATATITYADPVTTPSTPVLALTGAESYQLALLALLALGAGFGMLRFSNTLLIVRKDDE